MTHSHTTRAGSADPFSTFLHTADRRLARNGLGPTARDGRGEAGQNATEAVLLRTLAELPARQKAQAGDLGRRLSLTAVQIAVLLARLDERGLVVFGADGDEEVVELTTAGRAAAQASLDPDNRSDGQVDGRPG
jgi:DNA-binding MarR family transcriptional regulator